MLKFGIMGNTILFIGSVLFVILFQMIFGAENVFIGVSIIMASLTMLRKDLTLSPVKNGLRLILINIIIGIASFLSIEYLGLSIIFSFLIFYFLGYYFFNSLSKPLYVPFALEYLYLILVPVSNKSIPLHLLALAMGGLIIMIVNYIYYKNNTIKNEDSLLIDLCKTLAKKCRVLIAYESSAELDILLDNSICNLREILYEKITDKFSLSDELTIKLSIIDSIEKLNMLLIPLHKDEDERHVLKEVSVFLATIESVIKTKKLFELEDTLYKIKLREDNKPLWSSTCLSILNILYFINEALSELVNTSKKTNKTSFSLSDTIRRFTLEGKNFPIFSYKFCFALRIAIGMTLATFLSNFFIFSEGIFVIVTTFSILLPLYELEKNKFYNKTLGTLISAIISYIVFSVFKGFGIETLILLIISYFYAIYNKEFKYSGILISICSFGIGFIVYDSINIFNMNIIFLIFSGIVISIICENFLLPYNFKNTKNNLTKIYKNTLIEFLQEVHNLMVGEKHSNIMNTLLSFTHTLENRMVFNNKYLKSEADVKFIKEQRILFFSIYEFYLWIDNNDINQKIKSKLIKIINSLLNEDEVSINTINVIKTEFSSNITMEDNIALNTLDEIIKQIYNTSI